MAFYHGKTHETCTRILFYTCVSPKSSIYGSLNKGFKKLQIIREIQIPGRACITVAIIKGLLQKVLEENILFQYTLLFISILENFKFKNTSI